MPVQEYKRFKLFDAQKDDIRNKLKDVEFLIIDEHGMLGQRNFYTIDWNLRKVFESDKPFGGKSVIMFGDYTQLNPVRDRRVYEKPSKAEMTQKESTYQKAFMLYRQFKEVVYLTENKRIDRTKPDSLEFASLLEDFQNYNVKKRTEDLLRTRFAMNLNKEEREKFKDALRIMWRNREVNGYNAEKLMESGNFIFQIDAINSCQAAKNCSSEDFMGL